MLRLMLNRHSALRIPRESWFLIPLIEELPCHGNLDSRQRERAFEIIRTHSRWKDWECEDEVLREAIEESAPADLRGLVDAVFRRCAGLGTARRWGDKTPKYSFYATRIAELFPDAVFIHMVRDARDVYLSMRLARWFGGSARRIGGYWVGTTGSAMKLRNLGTKRYYELHYEKLVRDPRGELEKVCEFLSEDFEPRMLEFYQNAGTETAPWEKDLHIKTRRPSSPDDLDRWKRELPWWRVMLFEAVARDTMSQIGQPSRFGAGWEPLRRIIRGMFRLRALGIDLRIRISNRLGIFRRE